MGVCNSVSGPLLPVNVRRKKTKKLVPVILIITIISLIIIIKIKIKIIIIIIIIIIMNTTTTTTKTTAIKVIIIMHVKKYDFNDHTSASEAVARDAKSPSTTADVVSIA